MKPVAQTLALIILFGGVCPAQEAPDTLGVRSDDTGELAFDQRSEQDALAELARLSAMLENPVDLTSASESELLTIPGFDRGLARLVLDSVVRGRRWSVAELARSGASGRERLAAAIPFVVSTDEPRRGLLPVVSGSFRTRAEAVVSQRPAEALQASGSRWKIVQRIVLESPRCEEGLALKGGLVTEKDAGEGRLVDHASGFLWLRPAGGLELSVGDFALEGAMGLAFGARRGPHPSGSEAWKSLVARPRATSSESGGLRGVLAAYRSGRLEAALFYSNRALHARLNDSSGVTSFYEEGLFRTASEEALRSRTRERALGTRLAVRIAQNLRLGASACESMFVHPIAAASFKASGQRRFWVGAVDALLTLSRVELGVEYASDGSGGALAGSLDARMSAGLRAHAAVRRIDAGFMSLHGTPVPAPGGGSALALGIRWMIREGVRAELSSDLQRSPGAGPGRLALSSRTIAARFEWDVPGPLALALHLRAQRSDETASALDELGRRVLGCGQGRTRSGRLTLEYVPIAAIRLKCALEVRTVSAAATGNTGGAFSMTHELRWHPRRWLELELCATSYATDSYAARLYGWERTVRGVLSQTLLYGSGFRTSAYVRLTLGEHVDAELHFSETDRRLEQEPGGRMGLESTGRRTFGAQLEVRL